MLLDLAKGNILVTGGAGFMGSAFIRYVLKKTGFTGNLINLDCLTYAANKMNLALVEGDSRYHFVKGDIRDRMLLNHLHEKFSFSGIVHFAAESHVDRSITDPEIFLETNVIGTYRLLEFVRENASIHFHHISTDEVYGSLGSKGVFREDSPYQPNSPYAAAKASSDHFVGAYGKTYGLSWTLSHATNNYGPYQFPEKLIPLMIVHLIGKRPLPLYGRGSNVRSWLYVEDHSRAIWTILEKGKGGEVYNIGSGEEWTNYDLLLVLIEIFATLIGEKKEKFLKLITFVKDRPGHDYRYALDINKIVSELGWRPQYSLQEGLKETVQWFLHHLDWIKGSHTKEYERWMENHYSQLGAHLTQKIIFQ